MKVKIAVSNRHLHLSKDDAAKLFGKNHNFQKLKDLKQTGQMAYKETVNIATKKGEIKNVRVLGPIREYTQVELSQTDARKLGIEPPIRDSGDLKNSESVTIIGPKGSFRKDDTVIIANRHIHMNTEDAKSLGLHNNDVVKVLVDTPRGGIFNNVHVKIDESYVLEMHVDTDEANAFGIKNGSEGDII